eukprot:550102_1
MISIMKILPSLLMICPNYCGIIIQHVSKHTTHTFGDWGENHESTLRQLVDTIEQRLRIDINSYELRSAGTNQVIDTTNQLNEELIDVDGINGNFWGEEDITLILEPALLPTRIPIEDCTFRKQEIILSEDNEIGQINLSANCTLSMDFYFYPNTSEIRHWRAIFVSEFINIGFCNWEGARNENKWWVRNIGVWDWFSVGESVDSYVAAKKPYHIFVHDVPDKCYFEVDGISMVITKHRDLRNERYWNGPQKMFAVKQNRFGHFGTVWPGIIKQFHVRVDQHTIDMYETDNISDVGDIMQHNENHNEIESGIYILCLMIVIVFLVSVILYKITK